MIRSCRCSSVWHASSKANLFLAFLDDLCVLCSPERVGEVHKVIQQELWSRANIRVQEDESVEQGRRRATWMRRIDSRSKDGQGECHSEGWGP